MRKRTLIVAVTTTATALVFSVLSLINTDKFTVEHMNSDVAKAAITVIFSTALAFVAWCYHSSVCAHSYQKECDIVRSAIRENPELVIKDSKSKETKSKDKEKTMLAVRIILTVLALLLIILGIMNGGMADVLAKAVKICTECIGLG